MRKFAAIGLLLLCACVSRPEPEPAVMRESAPPWSAPRDAVSYIDAAGLERRPYGEESDPWIVKFTLRIRGEKVPVPAFIGMDRLRAVQAVLHTHGEEGDVWLEGPKNEEATLGNLFTLWGVKFDGRCIATYCENLRVIADQKPVTNPVDFRLRGHKVVDVTVG